MLFDIYHHTILSGKDAQSMFEHLLLKYSVNNLLDPVIILYKYYHIRVFKKLFYSSRESLRIDSTMVTKFKLPRCPEEKLHYMYCHRLIL